MAKSKVSSATDIVSFDVDLTPAQKSLKDFSKMLTSTFKGSDLPKLEVQFSYEPFKKVSKWLTAFFNRVKDTKLETRPVTLNLTTAKSELDKFFARFTKQTLDVDLDLKLASLKKDWQNFKNNNFKNKVKLDVSFDAQALRSKFATWKKSIAKFPVRFTFDHINAFQILNVQMAAFYAKWQANPLNLSVFLKRGGKSSYTLGQVADDFDRASIAKDKFAANVAQKFPFLERAFNNLASTAVVMGQRIHNAFSQNSAAITGISNTVRHMKAMGGAANMFAKPTQQGKHFGGMLKDLGTKARLFAFDFYIFGLAVSNGLVRPLSIATQEFREFEQNMKNAQVLSGATDAEFSKIADTVNRLGQNSRYSKVELSGLVDEFARAGVSSETINSALESVVNLADAVGRFGNRTQNLKESQDILLEGFFAFRKQYAGIAEDRVFDKIADSIAAAANASKADLTDFGYTMNQVTPSAIAAGIALNEMLAVNATMKQVMGSGRMAASALNQTLVQLATLPTESIYGSIVARLEQVGMSADDANPRVVGLVKAIDNLLSLNLGDGELKRIFGTEGSRTPEILRELREEYTRIHGEITATETSVVKLNTAEEIANKTRETANYKMEVMLSNFVELRVELGRLIGEIFVDYSAALLDIIKNGGEWLKTNGETIKSTLISVTTFAALAMGAYALGIAFQALIKVVLVARTVYTALLKVMMVSKGVYYVIALFLGKQLTPQLLRYMATLFGVSRATLLANLSFIKQNLTLKALGKAFTFAALKAAIFRVSLSGIAAIITGAGIIAGIVYLVREFNHLNDSIKEGIDITPSYTDQINSIADEYSDAAVGVRKYLTELDERLKKERELIALTTTLSKLTPEQQARKTELEQEIPLDSIPAEIKKIEAARAAVLSLVNLENQKQKDLNDSLNNYLTLLREAEKTRKDPLGHADALTQAANIYFDAIKRNNALSAKDAKDGKLDFREKEEYLNNLAIIENTEKKFGDAAYFQEALSHRKNTLLKILPIISDYQKVSAKIASGEKDSSYGRFAYSNLKRNVLPQDDFLRQLSPEFNSLRENGLLFDEAIKKIDLAPLIEQAGQLGAQIQVAATVSKQFGMTAEQIATLSPELVAKAADYAEKSSEIEETINEGIVLGLDEMGRKQHDVNKKAQDLIKKYTEHKELVSDTLELVRAEIKILEDKGELTEEDQKKLNDLKTQEKNLFERMMRIATNIAAVTNAQLSDLKKITLEKEAQLKLDQDSLKAEREKLEASILRAKGKTDAADSQSLKTDFDSDIVKLEADLIKATTEEEKESIKERIRLRSELYEEEKKNLEKKQAEENKSFLEGIRHRNMELDDERKFAAEREKIAKELQDNLDAINNREGLTEQQRSEARSQVRSTAGKQMQEVDKREVEEKIGKEKEKIEKFVELAQKELDKKIEAAQNKKGGAKLVEKYKAQKEELEKQKGIWIDLVEQGGKFEGQMMNAAKFMENIRKEAERKKNLEKETLNIAMQLARAQFAYQQRLKAYNTLKAAGKDTRGVDYELAKDRGKIAGLGGLLGKRAGEAGMNIDTTSLSDTSTIEQQAARIEELKKQISTGIQSVVSLVANGANSIGTTFSTGLNTWFDKILNDSLDFMHELIRILDPHEPKSPPLVKVVATGVQDIGKEFGKLNIGHNVLKDILPNYSSATVKPNYSGMANMQSIAPRIHNIPDNNRPTTNVNSNYTDTYNINNNIDSDNVIRKIERRKRNRFNSSGGF